MRSDGFRLSLGTHFSGTFVPARSSYNQESESGSTDFESLVNLYYGPLFRFAMSLTHAEANALDLVQDTFLIWAEKGRQLRDPSKTKPWLFTTLHRRFLESARRAARFPHVDIDEAAPDLPSVDPPDYANRLDAQTILELLARVDLQFRPALALFYLEDYSYNEIAEILEVPLGTVKSRLARGLAQLKTLVARRLTEGRDKEPGDT